MILVAQEGFEPSALGYEPSELPLLHRASLILMGCGQCRTIESMADISAFHCQNEVLVSQIQSDYSFFHVCTPQCGQK